MEINWVAQGIGFIGFILVVINFQVPKRDTIMNIRIVASLLYSIHYALLSAWTGSAMSFIASLRTVVFKQRTHKKWANSRWWLVCFLSIIALFVFLTWEGRRSLLLLVAMTIGMFAFWSKEPKHIRILIFCMSPFWFAYAYISSSYPGILTSIFEIISVSIGIFRFDILGKKEKKFEIPFD